MQDEGKVSRLCYGKDIKEICLHLYQGRTANLACLCSYRILVVDWWIWESWHTLIKQKDEKNHFLVWNNTVFPEVMWSSCNMCRHKLSDSWSNKIPFQHWWTGARGSWNEAFWRSLSGWSLQLLWFANYLNVPNISKRLIEWQWHPGTGAASGRLQRRLSY